MSFLARVVNPRCVLFALLFSTAIHLPSGVFAGGGENAAYIALGFVMLAILLLSGKIGSVVERFGVPSVLGEIFAGIVLAFVGWLGWQGLEDLRASTIMQFFAELGAVILLFQIGLESDVKKMFKVGKSALFVAVVGVVVPFITGSLVLGPILLPGLSQIAYLFVGASLVATSVGITATIFKDMKLTKSNACQTVLGAAVIDDILGLIVLAVVVALAAGSAITPMFVGTIAIKAIGFLVLAIVIGQIAAPWLSKLFSLISTGTGMKLTLALTFALFYAYLASLAGLAPIIGAFAAGLILDAVHFNSFDQPAIVEDLKKIRGLDDEEKERINKLIEKHKHAHVEDLITNLGYMLIPVFFVYTGLQIDFATLLNPNIYLIALVLSLGAIWSKMIAGVVASGNWNEKLLIGTSLVPRGEVGLIFASIGKGLGVLDSFAFSVIIVVIVTTTFIGPLMMKALLTRMQREDIGFILGPAYLSRSSKVRFVYKTIENMRTRMGART